MKKITLVTGIDWSGLYVDDKLVCEDSHLEEEHWLAALKEAGVNVTKKEADQELLDIEGSLPEEL